MRRSFVNDMGDEAKEKAAKALYLPYLSRERNPKNS
jgi:hypothetical protein